MWCSRSPALDGAAWLTVAMAISALGALHVVVLTGARIPYAMARDGMFFQFAKRVQPSLPHPSGALIFLGCLAALLALSGTYEELYSLFVFGAWIFFALTAIALVSFAQKRAQPIPAVPRLGPSLYNAHLFDCRSFPHRELVDGPARALLAGTGSDPGRRSLLLPLAQGTSRLRGIQRTESNVS